ncbi:zinc transporter ZIP1-like [Phlebotomus argentipes]|uniref:zinc transporter ZIP1-like n=1 Tax=Phlebotomus argentipes TaxID=94469 RepID=UPI002892B13B|nr:zinc transporter ZIP1-like [Phlebotomus argentipes]XP_059609737.1 zinc transporter ZIP1-like [Phlebotomus argentipes]
MENQDDGQSVMVAKVTAMTVLFVGSLLLGLAPFKLATWCRWHEAGRKSRTGRIIGALLCFGGGVLLATTFLHLLPEVSHNLTALQADGLLPEFPVSAAELLMCAGFFLMCFVEEVVHVVMRRGQRAEVETAFERASRSSVRNGSASTVDLVVEGKQMTGLEAVHVQVPAGHTHLHGHTHVLTDNDVLVSSFRGLLVVLALSVHELFEGLAVGLESSSSAVWYMFGAVAAHKLVLAFCVGVELVVTSTRHYLAAIYVITFAAVSPIGIGIGLAITSLNTTATGTAAVLQGIATGTLLYIVFFEILNRDRSGILKFLSTVIGFVLMLGLQLLSGHHHNQDDHGHSHSRRR